MAKMDLSSSPPTDTNVVGHKVTFEQVAKLADAIFEKGELPSVLHIRGLLSDVTVSNAEISKHLAHWQQLQLDSVDEKKTQTKI
jgi:hypothetical protein